MCIESTSSLSYDKTSWFLTSMYNNWNNFYEIIEVFVLVIFKLCMNVIVCYLYWCRTKSMKISKVKSDSVYQRRIANTMTKRKKGRRRRNTNTDLQNTTQKTVAFLFIVYSLSSSCPIVCWRVHVLFTLFVFIVHSGDLLCCVFVSCVFVLCTVCSQFLWIVHFRLSHPLFIL